MKSVEAGNIFVEIIDRVKTLDPMNSRTWFDDLKAVRFSGGSLEVGCPDDATVQFLRENCKKAFTQAAQQITGYLVTIDFSVFGEKKVQHGGHSAEVLKLHPDYKFENFVVGPSNRLAHASCVAVSQSLGNTYNPLFLYGNSGLGKTHLLHAVCCEAKTRNNKAVIQYISCEDFVNSFIRAIEQGNLSGFQSQYRNVDMLVIDDVQFLREREQSQEEFFHTFNTLYNSGKQIILSSDHSPSELESLEERLISRFSWGLVTRIDPPTYDTRVAIVQKKAHLRGLSVSEEIAEYIAHKVQANIRELEGALTKIYAVAQISGEEITLELAKRSLDGQSQSAIRNITITGIADVVTRHFDVRLTDLQSRKRSQSITTPRQICMYLARKVTNYSLEEIGGHLGGRDHTTVMHACHKISEAEVNDPQMATLLSDLTRKITEGRQG